MKPDATQAQLSNKDAHATAATRSATAPSLILVVDDNAMNRDMLSRRLRRRQYDVEEVASGREALERIEQQHFDLILLDIMMPGMSGLEVLQTLRETYDMVELPIIMATVKGASEDIVESLRLGANDYVTKPIDFPVVLARVQTQLMLKTAMQEVQELAEQLSVRNRFIRNTFGRYLSEEVVSSLLETPEGLELGGTSRTASILMSDLRGFSSISETLPPERVVTLLNHYLGAMTDVISKHGGTIDEFIGDAILVIFGAPEPYQDHATRAVACALDMQLAMEQVNAQNRHHGLPEVEMGIGINTGAVVVGNIGSHRRAKYGVVGRHVNLASRIEAYTVGGQVLISNSTVEAVGDCLRIHDHLQVCPKGSSELMTLYDVTGIGGSYDLFLPERVTRFTTLETSLPLRFAVLDGIHVPELKAQGYIEQLSDNEVIVRSDDRVSLMDNIKMRLVDESDTPDPGDMYGKVVGLEEDAQSFRVRLSYVNPELKKGLTKRLG
jgi:class 3 adenylate cyclase